MTKTTLRYLNKHKIEYLSNVFSQTITWISVVITFFASLIAILPNDSAIQIGMINIANFIFNSPLNIFLFIFVFLTTSAIVNFPRMKTTYKDNITDIKVIIECCDLLKQKGLKIIHCVDTFDCELGSIISANSLHGLFLKHAEQNKVDIDSQIDDYMSHNQNYETDSTLPGRTKRFPLATLCPVSINNDMFCFAAFTHLQSDGSITITKAEYISYLKNLWLNLAEPKIRQEEINVAVMGNRFVDLPSDFSTEQKIDLMIQSFYAAARERSCCRTLRICIHENNATEVDFQHYNTIIGHLSKRPIF